MPFNKPVKENAPNPFVVVEALEDPLRATVAPLPPAAGAIAPEIVKEPVPPLPPEDDVP